MANNYKETASARHRQRLLTLINHPYSTVNHRSGNRPVFLQHQ
jgi:hypothetical protein